MVWDEKRSWGGNGKVQIRLAVDGNYDNIIDCLYKQ